MREAEDLQRWLAIWKQVASGGDNFGEDYEHVLVREDTGGRSWVTRSESCWAGWRRHNRIMEYAFGVERASNIATQLYPVAEYPD